MGATRGWEIRSEALQLRNWRGSSRDCACCGRSRRRSCEGGRRRPDRVAGARVFGWPSSIGWFLLLGQWIGSGRCMVVVPAEKMVLGSIRSSRCSAMGRSKAFCENPNPRSFLLLREWFGKGENNKTLANLKRDGLVAREMRSLFKLPTSAEIVLSVSLHTVLTAPIFCISMDVELKATSNLRYKHETAVSQNYVILKYIQSI